MQRYPTQNSDREYLRYLEQRISALERTISYLRTNITDVSKVLRKLNLLPPEDKS